MTPEGPESTAPAVELAVLDLAQLRDYRVRLGTEEDRVSYWRRLTGTRIDVLQTEPGSRGTPVTLSFDELVRALGDTGSGRARRTLGRIVGAEPLPDLPELCEMWSVRLDLGDPDGVVEAVRRLHVAEHQLRAYRGALHERIDEATRELILRYRADPGAALAAIPRD